MDLGTCGEEAFHIWHRAYAADRCQEIDDALMNEIYKIFTDSTT